MSYDKKKKILSPEAKKIEKSLQLLVRKRNYNSFSDEELRLIGLLERHEKIAVEKNIRDTYITTLVNKYVAYDESSVGLAESELVLLLFNLLPGYESSNLPEAHENFKPRCKEILATMERGATELDYILYTEWSNVRKRADLIINNLADRLGQEIKGGKKLGLLDELKREAEQNEASASSADELAEADKTAVQSAALPEEPTETPFNLFADERLYNIDLSHEPYLGCEGSLSFIWNALQDSEPLSNLCLDGSEGTGKSRKALEYARRHMDDYQIICWINAWDEACLVSSMLSFLKAAGVRIIMYTSQAIKSLFWKFFRENTGWLIIFDDCLLTDESSNGMLDQQPALLTGSFLNTIITIDQIQNTKLQRVKNPFDPDIYDELMLKNMLGLTELGRAERNLLDFCAGDLTTLLLVANYILHTGGVDCNAYLKLIKMHGADKDSDDIRFVTLPAFDMLLQSVHERLKDSDRLYMAVQQTLVICAVLSFTSLDLKFLSTAFAVFPNPLLAVCRDDYKRSQLVDILKEFGFFEIREGVLQYSHRLHSICRLYFDSEIKDKICHEVLSAMQAMLPIIKNRCSYIDETEIMFHVSPYMNGFCSYMTTNGATRAELLEKYPDIVRNTSCWKVV